MSRSLAIYAERSANIISRMIRSRPLSFEATPLGIALLLFASCGLPPLVYSSSSLGEAKAKAYTRVIAGGFQYVQSCGFAEMVYEKKSMRITEKKRSRFLSKIISSGEGAFCTPLVFI